MNIGLIMAGGTGNRMGQDIPKQFMHIADCPIIIHTLLAFEKHPNIDLIAVVCLEGWDTVLKAYAKQFSVTKLKYIFKNGTTGMESIHNGIYGLKQEGVDDNAIVLIHDAVRPFVSSEIISSNIAVCEKYGYAITGIKCTEVVLESDDGFISTKCPMSREKIIRTQTPQTFRLKDIMNAHEKAKSKGIDNSIASCDLLSTLGDYTMHIVPGSEKNLKITTVEDLEIFSALLHTRKANWLS